MCETALPSTTPPWYERSHGVFTATSLTARCALEVAAPRRLPANACCVEPDRFAALPPGDVKAGVERSCTSTVGPAGVRLVICTGTELAACMMSSEPIGTLPLPVVGACGAAAGVVGTVVEPPPEQPARAAAVQHRGDREPRER